MRKSLDDKKANALAKRLNRQLKEDVFKDRFWARQFQKCRYDGLSYYLYELRDREQPERNKLIVGWMNIYELERKLFFEMNDFIITSDFWEKYHRQKEEQK